LNVSGRGGPLQDLLNAGHVLGTYEQLVLLDPPEDRVHPERVGGQEFDADPFGSTGLGDHLGHEAVRADGDLHGGCGHVPMVRRGRAGVW